MIDRFLYAFFGFFDDIAAKLNEVTTFDVGEKNKKKRKTKKCKYCHCKCHCKKEFHTHHWDNEICICEECKCTKR